MTNDVGDGSSMNQKMLLRLLVISQKNFNPYSAFLACQKNIYIKPAIMRKMTKNWDFGHVEGTVGPCLIGAIGTEDFLPLSQDNL